ncbi:MAG TPA: hypothetical protein PK762_10715 [Candidatus Kapabacteria bacterium]|nr:hypothetical protein [Candidatus Kapabacteria bacterium]
MPAPLHSHSVRKYEDEIGRFTSIDPLCFVKNINYKIFQFFISFKTKKGKLMEAINYIYNEVGEKTAFLINLELLQNFSIEEIEDIKDIIDFELSKFVESVDYDKEIQRILGRNN